MTDLRLFASYVFISRGAGPSSPVFCHYKDDGIWSLRKLRAAAEASRLVIAKGPCAEQGHLVYLTSYMDGLADVFLGRPSNA